MSSDTSAKPATDTGEAKPATTDGSGPSTDGADMTIARVGARVRSLRSRQGLTLREVAEQTGVSTSMLSMLERGVASPSVGTLVSVASALGVHMYELFDQPHRDETSPVTRLADQPRATAKDGASRRIVHHDRISGVELAVNEYAPGSASGSHPTHHEGREFGFVLQGSLRVHLDGKDYDLDPGDAIAYTSTRPHRISNEGTDVTVAVWVNIDQNPA